MRYLFLTVLTTVMVCSGCDDEDPCSGSASVFEPSDFSAIADCTSISGSLFVVCPSCTDLSELNSLTSVGHNLRIDDNDALTNLNGLSGLTSVGGLEIGGNDALTNLNGLSNITSVGGDLEIWNNDALINLDGLSGITGSVGGGLKIWDNDALTNLDGLSALTSIGTYFDIYFNVGLPDCEACDLLDQLSSTPTDIDVHDNLDDTCTPVPASCP